MKCMILVIAIAGGQNRIFCKLTLFNRRARQFCFSLLVVISRPQIRNIHLSGRMILPGSLIPSDKYFLKNLTFVVCISTRVATSPFQSNSLRGQGEDQQLKSLVLPGLPEEVVMISRPVGQEGLCFLVVDNFAM